MKSAVPLLITVVLLSSSCRRVGKEAAEPKLETKTVTRTVTLFFEGADMTLSPESRTLPLPEPESAALGNVVRELVKGSANAAVPKLFPADTVVRGVYSLADGTAIVDLGGASLVNGWTTGSHAEIMALYSVVQTLSTNFRIQKVRFLVNGQPAETLAGHARLDLPLRPNPTLLAPQSARR